MTIQNSAETKKISDLEGELRAARARIRELELQVAEDRRQIIARDIQLETYTELRARALATQLLSLLKRSSDGRTARPSEPR